MHVRERNNAVRSTTVGSNFLLECDQVLDFKYILEGGGGGDMPPDSSSNNLVLTNVQKYEVPHAAPYVCVYLYNHVSILQ